MDEELLAKMRQRVAKARWLADNSTDPAIAKALREMADEGEADIARVQAAR